MSATDDRDDVVERPVARMFRGLMEEIEGIAPFVLAGGGLVASVAFTLSISLVSALWVFFVSTAVIIGLVLILS